MADEHQDYHHGDHNVYGAIRGADWRDSSPKIILQNRALAANRGIAMIGVIAIDPPSGGPLGSGNPTPAATARMGPSTKASFITFLTYRFPPNATVGYPPTAHIEDVAARPKKCL